MVQRVKPEGFEYFHLRTCPQSAFEKRTQFECDPYYSNRSRPAFAFGVLRPAVHFPSAPSTKIGPKRLQNVTPSFLHCPTLMLWPVRSLDQNQLRIEPTER